MPPPSTHEAGEGEPDPARLPWRTFLPFLAGATILALSYGASFMLPDALRSAGLPPASAGRMTFSGLSTFQSLLAAAHGVPPEAFFLTFTATTVTLRFCAASRIGRLRLPRLAVALALAMLAGLIGLAASGGHLGVWVAATLVFSIGYGLNYLTLNALVVAMAERDGLPVPVASQVFTIGYFVGLFGFPLVAERTIALAGDDAVITVLAGIALADVVVALAMMLGEPDGA